MALKFTTSHIEDALAIFRQYKLLGERAMAQVSDAQLFASLDEESNSIAIIVKHITGNMRSRWTDFLTTDGEKPDRNRDCEFVDPPATREALLSEWEDGWARVFGAIEPLTDEDLARVVTIRGEAHSVMQAINRQLAHYPQHVGQIVLLAKHYAGEQWQTLSVARNKSGEFNRKVATGEASQR
ncbi:MAG TPA: DUF1572 domain-containing protein [Terracidiphilus sp.]|nr:DUF1572 domain-containing protein [Terracidiphilus sp.]